MRKKKKTKHPLVTSGLTLLFVLALFTGITLAWFTSVLPGDTIAQMGHLRVQVLGYDAEGQPLGGTDQVTNDLGVSDLPLITENGFEPGRWGTKYIKVTNLGSLDLKFALGLRFSVAGEVNLWETLRYRLTPVDRNDISDLPANLTPAPPTIPPAWQVFPKDPAIGSQVLRTAVPGGGWPQFANEPNEIIYRLDYMMCPGSGNSYQGVMIKADLAVTAIQAIADEDPDALA
ncbi:MAG: hypothetical protein LBC26_06220 [Oscillospiraceae bacterium]|jgi:hypothetical protein|nr:hypothetical protein [Oscillospiraceae bacterium]